MDLVKSLIADVPDFPKPGILFKDITPVLENPAGLAQIVDAFAQRYAQQEITHFLGIESRGFIFASALAYKLEKGLVLARKPGKLPRKTFSASYELEYGEDSLEIHQDSLGSNDRVVIVDDLIATGGTAKAVCDLVRLCGADPVELAVVIELAFLEGRSKIEPLNTHALLTY